MERSLDAMKTALRVLTAITKRHHPDEVDLQSLRQLAPLVGNLPPDELACEVIQLAIKHRAEVRKGCSVGALYAPRDNTEYLT